MLIKTDFGEDCYQCVHLRIRNAYLK